MTYWGLADVSLPGWLAVLGGMTLGGCLYAAGFREGRRPAAKPVVSPWPEIGGDDAD